jgi:hypothetical protein
MKYQQPTFTLPTTNRKMNQTDWEIAMGLRSPDGKVRKRRRRKDDDRTCPGTVGGPGACTCRDACCE